MMLRICEFWLLQEAKVKIDSKNFVAFIFAISLTYSPFAMAYIGPGLGSGAVAAVLGTVAGLLMLIVGVVWYPLKRLISYLRSKK